MANDERRDLELDAVLDIETEDWDRFVAGGILYADGCYRSYWWQSEDSYADEILSIDGVVGAHNGGGFDFKWLLDRALRRSKRRRIKCVLSGSNVVKAWIGDLILVDTFALFKIPLRDLSKAAGVRKVQTGLQCDCGKGCGGYCRIKRVGMSDAEKKALLHYLEQDCRSLWDSVEVFRSFASANDIDLCTTVGSSAWRSARRMLGLRPPDLGNAGHKIVRRSYYGGRVQVFRPLASRGAEADVNAMYPSRLAQVPMPCGRTTHVWGVDAGRAYSAGREGTYQARVVVPEMHIPPLPHRCKDGRIAYPTGAFSGFWTGVELRYAEEVGCTVDPQEAIVFESSKIIFEAWVEKIWNLRYSAAGGKSGPLGTFLKFLANSLTGKFGANPLQEEVVFSPKRLITCSSMSPCKRRDGHDCGECCVNGHCNFWCGAHRPLFPDLEIYAVRRFRIDDCAHPEWASTLTAASRVLLHKQLVADGSGGSTAVYCDTDSVFSTEPRTWNIGPALGQFEDKGPWQNFHAIAPKVYTYERAQIRIVKAKGVLLPKPTDPEALDIAWRKLAAGEAVGKERQGIIGFRAGARSGKFFSAGKRIRRIKRPGFGDRILIGDITRPPTIKETLKWR